jgi:hypothetical protein
VNIKPQFLKALKERNGGLWDAKRVVTVPVYAAWVQAVSSAEGLGTYAVSCSSILQTLNELLEEHVDAGTIGGAFCQGVYFDRDSCQLTAKIAAVTPQQPDSTVLLYNVRCNARFSVGAGPLHAMEAWVG